MTENLWGLEPFKPGPVNSPRRIITEQARILEAITGGIVFGTIERVVKERYDREEFRSKEFCWSLVVFAPKLDGYAKSVLRIYHNIEMYPAILYSQHLTDGDIVVVDYEGWPTSVLQALDCPTEVDLKNALKKVFSSPGVKGLITAMIAQVTDIDALNMAS